MVTTAVITTRGHEETGREAARSEGHWGSAAGGSVKGVLGDVEVGMKMRMRWRWGRNSGALQGDVARAWAWGNSRGTGGHWERDVQCWEDARAASRGNTEGSGGAGAELGCLMLWGCWMG